MENAVDALKLAFVMFAFVVAITLTFSLVSQAKSTADVVLYHSDETNYYENLKSSEENRTVTSSEVISSLYRYYKESIGVTVKFRTGQTFTFDLNNNETVFEDNGKISEDKKLTSESDREANLEIFIKKILKRDSVYKEEFTEIPISGIYSYGSDGTELTISSGGKKVYITYTEQ